jgi:hypothetical protein
MTTLEKLPKDLNKVSQGPDDTSSLPSEAMDKDPSARLHLSILSLLDLF